MKILKTDRGEVIVEHDSGKRVFINSRGRAYEDAARLGNLEGWEVVYETPKPKRYMVAKNLDAETGGYAVLRPNGAYFIGTHDEKRAQKIADALNAQEGLEQ